MKRKLIAGTTTLVITVMLSGCSLVLTPSQMIKPPKSEPKQEEIKQAAEQFLPKGAKFTIPKGPGQIQNFVPIDMNNDGTNEIAVFFKGERSIGLLLLEQVDSRWRLKDKITGYGNTLVYVWFFDVNGDNQLEVFIGGESNGSDKKLIIYKQAGEKYEEFYRLTYDSFGVGDLEEDGKLEIASIVGVNKEIPSVKLQVHTLIDNYYQKEYEADAQHGEFPEDIVIGAASEAQQGIFVDMAKGAHSGVTELLVKENGKYKNVIRGQNEYDFLQTFKPYPLSSMDINNDGIIEIGVQTAPPETEHLPMAGIPWINNWYQWDGKDGLTSKPVLMEYSNYSEDYRLIIPENWYDKFTIKKEIDEETEVGYVYFIYLTPEKKKAELLTLQHIPKESWQKHEQQLQNHHQSYVLLSENNKNMVVAQLPQNNQEISDESLKEYNEMLLSEEDIRKYFVDLHSE